jgi:hypothetical protein
MRYVQFVLLSLCATSLCAVTPNNPLEDLNGSTDSAPSAHPASQSTSESSAPRLAASRICDILTWSNYTALVLEFRRTNAQNDSSCCLRFSAATDNPWDGSERDYRGCFSGDRFSFKWQPHNFQTMTVEDVIQDLGDRLSNFRNEEGQPLPGKPGPTTVRLYLTNLSNDLPSSAYLPHINILYVKGTNFSGLNGFDLPNLVEAKFRDISHEYFLDHTTHKHLPGLRFNTEYMAPPSSCILSSNIFDGETDRTFKLVSDHTYALPAAFTPHLESGRLQFRLDKKNSNHLGPSHNVSLTSTPMTSSISALFVPQNKILPSNRAAYSKEVLAQKLKERDFLITQNAFWVHPSSEKDALYIPPEMWMHIVSFIEKTSDLARLALSFLDISCLQQIAFEQLKKRPRPFALSDTLIRTPIYPKTRSSSESIKIKTKTFVWGLPYQMPEEYTHWPYKAVSLDGTFSTHIEETITSTNEYNEIGELLGTRFVVSWSSSNNAPVIVGDFFHTPNQNAESNDDDTLKRVMSAMVFDQAFGANQSHLALPQTPSMEGPAIQELSEADTKDINPKARAEGSDDGER